MRFVHHIYGHTDGIRGSGLGIRGFPVGAVGYAMRAVAFAFRTVASAFGTVASAFRRKSIVRDAFKRKNIVPSGSALIDRPRPRIERRYIGEMLEIHDDGGAPGGEGAEPRPRNFAGGGPAQVQGDIA